MEELNLFGVEEKKKSIETTSIDYIAARSILTKDIGIMEDSDFSLKAYNYIMDKVKYTEEQIKFIIPFFNMSKLLSIITIIISTIGYSQSSSQYMQLATEKYNNGDYQGAIENCSKAIKLKPNNPELYYKRGMVYLTIGENRQSAIEDFTKALQFAPKSSEIYWARGNAKKTLNDLVGATIDLETAIKLDSKNFSAYRNLAEIKSLQGDFTSSINYYNFYIENNATDDEIIIERGNVRTKQLRYKEALIDYNKAIQINPNNSIYFLARGKANFFIEDFESANVDFNKAIEINPNSLDLIYSIGTFFVEHERFNEALVYFDKILILDNKNSRTFLYRGIAKNGLEKFDEALLDLNRSIELEPDFSYSYLQRGFSKLQLGLEEQACIDFNKAKDRGDSEAEKYIKDYCE
jgi:serine/threonine-protein kinase